MSENLVVVKTFASETEAELALNHLAGHEIEGRIAKDDAGGMYPFLRQQGRGIRLLVHAEDAEEALELLENPEGLPEE